MADAQSRSRRAGAVELAMGSVLSVAFLLLAFVLSPLAATAIVIPTAVVASAWHAHNMPRHTPHSLTHPVFQSDAVIHAPKVSATADADDATHAA